MFNGIEYPTTNDLCNHRAVLVDPVDGLTRAGMAVVAQRQVLGVFDHGDAQVLVDALGYPGLVVDHAHRFCDPHEGKLDHEEEGQQPEEEGHPLFVRERIRLDVAGIQEEHSGLLAIQRLTEQDLVVHDLHFDEGQEGHERSDQRGQGQPGDQVEQLRLDMGPHAHVNAQELLEAQADSLRIFDCGFLAQYAPPLALPPPRGRAARRADGASPGPRLPESIQGGRLHTG